MTIRLRQAHQRDRGRDPVARPTRRQSPARPFTADALLTQTAIASYLRKHDAHWHVRGQGQPEDSAQRHPAMVPRRRKSPSRLVPRRPASPSTASCRPRYGRWEQREIWTTTALNDYLLFPSRAGLPHSPHPLPSAQGPGHRHLGRHLLGRDQPHPAHRRCPKASCASTAATGPSKTPLVIASSMTA